MKKIITIFLVIAALNSNAQDLDTVLVRNLSLQAQDWAFIIGGLNTTGDSATIIHYRRIRNKIQATPALTWTTVISIDSLPGAMVLDFYKTTKTANAGQIVSRYTAITNAISAKTNLSYWIGFFDSAMQSDYQRQRDRGKNLLIDN